jgi:aminopeptidase N
MATAFRTWRTLEEGRRGKAEAALKRIKDGGDLSRDLADIVERALAAP